MLPKDREFEDRYKESMLKKKKINRKEFWSKSPKRKLVLYLNSINVNIFNNLLKKSYEFLDINRECNYFSHERIAIYTSIFGKYDEINELDCVPDNCDFYIITDQNINEESCWKKIPINLKDYGLDGKSNIIKNRFFKMFPEKVFSDYKFSIYVDGNIKIKTDLTEFIHNMNQYGIKMHKHYRRNCVYKEIEKCLEVGRDTSEGLRRHMEHLMNEGMPEEYGLLEAPVIVREHHNPICLKLMNEWWQEFLEYSKRDQISLPYVLWKNNIKIEEIALLGNDIFSNYAFQRVKHNN